MSIEKGESAVKLKNSKIRVFFEIFILFVFVFVLRLYLTEPIEGSGDSFEKWYEAKRLLYGLDYSRLDHHTMRWSINILTVVFQKIFGTAASVYYYPSAFASALAALFLYGIGILLRGRLFAMLALILFVLHPRIVWSGSQLFPGIFSVCYILGGMYFLIVYIKKAKLQNLFISAVFILFAYGANVMNLFFLPAILIFLYWYARKFKIILYFAGVLVVGFCVETIWVDYILGDYSLPGRLALMGGHVEIMASGVAGIQSYMEIFQRWATLSNYWYLQTITGFFAAFYFLNNRKENKEAFLLSLCLLGFSLIITFGICSFDPISFVLPRRDRYLTITIPFSILLSLYAATLFGSKRYFIAAFGLLFLYYPVAIQYYLDAGKYGQVFEIDSFHDDICLQMEKGYGVIFADPKQARLYRAIFVKDQYSVGLNGGDKIAIYAIPRNTTKHNKNFIMFYMGLGKDVISKGLISPASSQYQYAIIDLKGTEILINKKWDILW